MKKKTIPYIYILFLIIFSDGFFAQDFILKISSKKLNDIKILNTIDFQKTHLDSTFLYNEIDRISDYLKHQGYFTNTVDSISKIDTNFTAYFSLGQKIERVVIRKLKNDFSFFGLDSITVSIEELEAMLNSASKELDNQGKSFSKIQLKNINIKDKTLFAELEVYQSKKRNINRVIVKGYELFSKSHIKHHFNIQKKSVFTKRKIKEISEATKSLPFVKELKPPEVLFTKDSTLLYIYLKKHQNNSFDALVNFASGENGNVLFNGHVDVNLNNILHTGENFELFWNRVGDEKQEFKVAAEIPFLLGSAFSLNTSFNIYKQDSTFLNVKFYSGVSYHLNSKSKIAITYDSETSENLLEETTTNLIENFNNFFLGLQFKYQIPKNDYFLNNKFYLEINPTLGRRKFFDTSSNQFKINFTASYIWEFNQRNSIYIRNKTGYLNSDTYVDNELFRIGGANSIRGFNEQSIFTNTFSFFNIEYRYLTSQTSYLYSVTDIGKVNDNKNLLGLGIGYLFSINNSQVSLSSVVGKSSINSFDLKDSKIIINWKVFF